jgi:hypothetical protein
VGFKDLMTCAECGAFLSRNGFPGHKRAFP